jgi:hypothetical protein
MGLLDFFRERSAPDGSPKRQDSSTELGQGHSKRAQYDEVVMDLSQRECRRAVRILAPGFQVDIHAALKGDPVEGLPPPGSRGARSVYGIMVELDNGNILMVRHRAEEGDAVGVLSAREGEGRIISPPQGGCRVTVGSGLGGAFGVDAEAKVCGIRIIGERIHSSDRGSFQEDSTANIFNALILNPNKRVVCEEIASGAIEEAYVRSSTNKSYRLRAVGDGTVSVESAFDMARREPSSFILRMDSFHVGQKLSLSESSLSGSSFQTSKILECAVSRSGGAADENFAEMQRRFSLQADPTLEDKTAAIVETKT